MTSQIPRGKSLPLPIGSNRCLCAACGEYFGGVTAFDMHRIGPAHDRRCKAPAQVSDSKGKPLLKVSKYGYWVAKYGCAK